MTKVVFTGGGSGGHLMSALALAEAMVGVDRSVQPFFIGGRRGIEAGVLPSRPWPFELLPFEPIYRGQWWRNAVVPLRNFQALRGVRRILRSVQPSLVVATGGYVSGPVVWAAARAGIPTVLQEQNALPGVTTRMLAPRVRQIHLGFPEALAHLKPGKDTAVFESGNPIVPPPDPRPDRTVAKRALGFDPAKPLVLVMGGSQGALAVNRVVASVLGAGLWPEGAQLFWQTGKASFEEFRNWRRPGQIEVQPFVDPIARAYAATDMVVARAGAMSIADLAAWCLPSVLIPLPTAAANHQFHNAKALQDSGAAVLLEQSNLTVSTLVDAIKSLLAEPAKLAALSSAIGTRGRPYAAREIAKRALSLV